jgi:8-oxo-dGTP pyrophosphatase MutT (NUDIX family)
VTFADVVTRLEHGLRGELPGAAAQAHLSPVPRRAWPAGFNPARIRNAAGLLLVFPDTPVTPTRARVERDGGPGDAHIVLTVRGDQLRHGGQISLPGGVVEPGETFEQAALREAHEEIALARESVRLLGALTPLDIPVSGFRLHPVIGVSETRPLLAPADGEVAHILEVSVDDLLDPTHFAMTTRDRDGVRLTIPGFHVHGREIWGATAMVLAEFLALLGWSGGRSS